jgi:hypothetical protein
MEITLDSIISILGLFIGGGGGAFFTWRFMRRKAKAEAVTAEVDAAKDMQDLYQQMLADTKEEREDRKKQIDELRSERDHYKDERNELRDKMEQLTRSFMDWRIEADNDRSKMKMDIAKLGRKVETMVPFMCGNLTCKDRQRVVLADDGTLKTKRPAKKDKPQDIEPLKQEDL